MVSIIFCLYVSRLGPRFSGAPGVLPTEDFGPSSLFSSFFFFSDPFLWFCPSSSWSSHSSFNSTTSLDGSSGRRSVSSSCARVELLVELNSEILNNNDFYTVGVKTETRSGPSEPNELTCPGFLQVQFRRYHLRSLLAKIHASNRPRHQQNLGHFGSSMSYFLMLLLDLDSI